MEKDTEESPYRQTDRYIEADNRQTEPEAETVSQRQTESKREGEREGGS